MAALYTRLAEKVRYARLMVAIDELGLTVDEAADWNRKYYGLSPERFRECYEDSKEDILC